MNRIEALMRDLTAAIREEVGALPTGVQTLADVQSAQSSVLSAQSPSATVPTSPAPQQSTLARIAAESVAPEGDTGAFTAEDVAIWRPKGARALLPA